jgi:hypothetical protein
MQWRAANAPDAWRQQLLQLERIHQQDHSGLSFDNASKLVVGFIVRTIAS